MKISEKIKQWIKRLKWIELCKKCGMNPDTYDIQQQSDELKDIE